ncbi:hypothetical protein NBH19_19250 [Rhizobium sp. S95]|uniref:Uncharacterized protein n=1 Tax=Ciceribacter sichuanensis TaxID=2949647 RepID=A0AAJ1BYE8_9HYPH|nr:MULTISPECIES: hypothetical protein [unclassified Ciceribacter]MCM2398212.1 hypothetical protein [Ciceribacter sp. S95]MCM2400543.1 hypothetical protein [Ciceribacter sp. S153]MCO5958217.1 hypothetical protein [Ciceribacter sp. S101]
MLDPVVFVMAVPLQLAEIRKQKNAAWDLRLQDLKSLGSKNLATSMSDGCALCQRSSAFRSPLTGAKIRKQAPCQFSAMLIKIMNFRLNFDFGLVPASFDRKTGLLKDCANALFRR